MKLTIFLLLLTATLYPQQAKVTAYRLIDPVDDGPCSIKSYAEHADVFSGSYVTAESDDPKLIEKLLEIKAECKNWPYKPFYCNNRMIGGDEIKNMVVITGKRNDTIFTDRDNQWIIFPEWRKAYLDQNGILKSSLTGRIKEFFDYDFDKQLRVKFGIETVDSIPISYIKHREKSLKDTSLPYMPEKRQLKIGSSKEIYLLGVDTISIDERRTTIIVDDEAGPFSINGLRPGDSEQQLKKLYPISTSVPLFYHTRFEDMQRKYYYLITIEKGVGSVAFMINDGRIDSIEIILDSRTR